MRYSMLEGLWNSAFNFQDEWLGAPVREHWTTERWCRENLESPRRLNIHAKHSPRTCKRFVSEIGVI